MTAYSQNGYVANDTSVLDTYTVPGSKVRLRLRTAKNEKNAMTLSEWLQRPTYALGGLLVLQNIAGFAFSAAVRWVAAF